MQRSFCSAPALQIDAHMLNELTDQNYTVAVASLLWCVL